MKNNGEILAGILSGFEECCFFLHNTKKFNIAEKILKEGFIFESQLSHSADRVNPSESIEITYFLLERKEYGSITVVIAIPRIIYDIYSEESNKNATGIEELMTITDPYFSENEELVYTLSPEHVLGYFNSKTAVFVKNLNWDPSFNNCLARKASRRLQ